MADQVDVVIVLDFQGTRAPAFELQALLFLASWMRHRGASRSWPLHLACIGEPPRSVRKLADAAGALITIHEPLALNARRSTNRLRGFEVTPKTDRLLLLDTDTLVLKDLGPLAETAGRGISVGLATVNHFPEPTWRRIYQTVGLPYPGPTGSCWCGDERLAAARRLTGEQRALCRHMPPYYNGGVVLSPWALDLGTIWRRHLERILPLFSGASPLDGWGNGGTGTEHALATTVEQLRLAGASVRAIPWTYHTRPLLLRAGVQPWGEVALFHYHNALKPHAASVGDLRALLYGRRAAAIREWLAGAVGLRAIRSPLFRRVPAGDLRAFEAFYDYLHKLHATCIRHLCNG